MVLSGTSLNTEMVCNFLFNLVNLLSFAAMPKRVENARIACLDFSLQKAKMHLGVSVVVEDPEQLEAIRKR